MPTFENGWICRECWSANREFDSRCYRCHTDRPQAAEDVVELAGVRAATTGDPPKVDVVTQARAEEASAPPRARFCLRCGHQLLSGASFCTRCGTRATAEDTVAASHAEPGPEASPGSADHSPRVAMPELRLPHLSRPHARDLVTRARAGYSSFIERRAIEWEMGMSALAAASVMLQLLPRWLPASADWSGSLSVAITALFVVEYATRLGAAQEPQSFARHHLVELAAVLPPLRALRILRLAWMKWLEPGWRSTVERWGPPARAALRAATGRTSLMVAWSGLLLLTAASVWGFASGGISDDRALPFALLVTCLAAFGGVTGSAMTLLALRRASRSGEAAEGARPSATPASTTPVKSGTSQHAPDGWRAAPNSAGG